MSSTLFMLASWLSLARPLKSLPFAPHPQEDAILGWQSTCSNEIFSSSMPSELFFAFLSPSDKSLSAVVPMKKQKIVFPSKSTSKQSSTQFNFRFDELPERIVRWRWWWIAVAHQRCASSLMQSLSIFSHLTKHRKPERNFHSSDAISHSSESSFSPKNKT